MGTPGTVTEQELRDFLEYSERNRLAFLNALITSIEHRITRIDRFSMGGGRFVKIPYRLVNKVLPSVGAATILPDTTKRAFIHSAARTCSLSGSSLRLRNLLTTFISSNPRFLREAAKEIALPTLSNAGRLFLQILPGEHINIHEILNPDSSTSFVAPHYLIQNMRLSEEQRETIFTCLLDAVKRQEEASTGAEISASARRFAFTARDALVFGFARHTECEYMFPVNNFMKIQLLQNPETIGLNLRTFRSVFHALSITEPYNNYPKEWLEELFPAPAC